MKKNSALLLLIFCLATAALAGDGIEALKRELAQATGSARNVVARRLVAALNAEGDSYQKRNENKESLPPYLEALALQEKELGEPPSAHLLNRIGLAELILGDYDKALDFLLRALAAAEKNNERTYITSSSYLIGYVHRDLRNFSLSLNYFNAAHEAALAAGDQYYAIMSLNEIGNVYVYQEQYDKALPYKEKSLELARKFANRKLLATCLHDMGHLHLMQDQAAKALPYFQEALAISREVGGQREIIIILINTADANRRMGRFNAGLACLDEALPLAEKSGLAKLLSDILETYSCIHEGMKNYPQALVYQRRYQELREHLFNEEKAKQTAEMQTRFEVEKKQRENELLRSEKRIASLALAKQRNQRNFLFFLALLILLLTALLYTRFRIKARANRELEAANSKISSQQAKLREAYRNMEDLAGHDQLTGLSNRRAFLEELEREAKRFQREQKPFTLVMTDLVGLKAVNDTLGHDAGDFVLRAAADLFSRSLRAQDTVARWGGDEFLFLLPGTTAQGAQVICASIQKKISNGDFRFNGNHLQLAVSIGIATFRAGISIEECLREADQEMYRSRRCGHEPADEK
ncbi:MAG: diguanylate cyclase [Candidatus Aminicenantes bacterium]|nr:diguanylate cyclase [Candidatus Aminicenantes bacterium]